MKPFLFTAHFPFGGSGGMAIGMQESLGDFAGVSGELEVLGSIDNDPLACQDFEAFTGVRATCGDLRIMTPEQIRTSAQGRYPDIIALSPPCKGLSGLLSEKQASSKKYRAMNRLVIIGVKRCLQAFKEQLPKFVLLENVPRITSKRGEKLLKAVSGLLKHWGYAVTGGTHDCGELGGLAQHRRRYLLIARHQEQVPVFVYQPPKRPVRPVRDVLEFLPLPDDKRGGPHHRMPRLKWITWLRLALIRAGGDWRDLPSELRIVSKSRPNLYGVAEWNQPTSTVTGSASVSGSNGVAAVADERAKDLAGRTPFNNVYRVTRWDETAGAVTAGGSPSSSGVSVADPRLGHTPRAGALYLVPWDEPAPTVTTSERVNHAGGAAATCDPRLAHAPRRGAWRIVRMEEPAPTVTGADGVGRSQAFGVADTRLSESSNRHQSKMRVEDFGEPAHTVTGSDRVGSGAPSVADPRLSCSPRSGTLGIIPWESPAGTICGSADVHQGSAAVADERVIDLAARPDPWPLIIALDGTVHRPLTTLELAMLQDFPFSMRDGSVFHLAGKSDSKARERIGNAVPPGAGRAIGEAILPSLIASAEGYTFTLGSTPIWVDGTEIAWTPVHLMAAGGHC